MKQERCTATSKQTGQPCRNYPIRGAKTCRLHGSSTKRARAAAARKLAERKALVEAKTLGVPVVVSPSDALLGQVHATAGHVAWLRGRVEELEPEALVWGRAQEKSGPDGLEEVKKAVPSIWYQLYVREREMLVKACEAALRAGVEERRVKLAEEQGALVAGVIRAILGDLGLSVEQQAAAAKVVPLRLRELAA